MTQLLSEPETALPRLEPLEGEGPGNPWLPEVVTIGQIVREVPGIVTYRLDFADSRAGAAFRFEPGQFNMLYVPGAGEVAISISSDPETPGTLLHTIRAAGNVTQLLARHREGDALGLRGPFGTSWPMHLCKGHDVVIACGGVGLAPLRPAIYWLMHHRSDFGRVIVLYGARTPGDLLFASEYDAWRDAGIEIETTVDIGDGEWRGNIGVVPVLFYRLRLRPEKTRILTCGPEIMIRFVVFEALARKIAKDRIHVSMERNMNCALGHCGHCQLGPAFVCMDGPVFTYKQLEPYLHVEDFEMPKPTLAVFKFASCDGCQLSILDAEDELLALTEHLEIAYFPEARSRMAEGPYDVGLVEGSITTEHDAERIKQIRRQCHYLVAIGACATAGGIQALRNWADVGTYVRTVYASPEYVHTLATSTPVSDQVLVDFELRGCPINVRQLLELVTALLAGRRPRMVRQSVCMECKARGTVCVAVAQGITCMGPITQCGCGAICPSYGRECFGCYGPKEQPNTASILRHSAEAGVPVTQLLHLLRNFNGYAPEFREASETLNGHTAATALRPTTVQPD